MPRISFLILFFIFISCRPASEQTVIEKHHFLADFDAIAESGLTNIVVEIPAGSNQKWEVDSETGFIQWERIEDDSLRIIPYLPYPANYGMVPQTWLPAEEGGDGDPLDVFLLGPSHERGTVQHGRLIGVLRMLDRGEQDDKLLAVDVDSWFSEIHTLDQLNDQFPGVVAILISWLENYKGDGIVQIQETGDETEARVILNRAVDAYERY